MFKSFFHDSILDEHRVTSASSSAVDRIFSVCSNILAHDSVSRPYPGTITSAWLNEMSFINPDLNSGLGGVRTNNLQKVKKKEFPSQCGRIKSESSLYVLMTHALKWSMVMFLSQSTLFNPQLHKAQSTRGRFSSALLSQCCFYGCEKKTNSVTKCRRESF